MEDIPITELELMTLAFVMFTFITYGLWWNKPLSVQCSYCVIENRNPELRNREDEAGVNEGANKEEQQQYDHGGRAGAIKEAKSAGCKGMWYLFKGIITFIGDAIYQSMVALVYGVLAIPHTLIKVINRLATTIRDTIQAAVEYVHCKGVVKALMRLIEQMFRPFLGIVGDEEFEKILSQRVTMFYAGFDEDDEEHLPTFIAALTIAVLFGAIHCIGWSLEFHLTQSNFYGTCLLS